jgi:hypothetical protein
MCRCVDTTTSPVVQIINQFRILSSHDYNLDLELDLELELDLDLDPNTIKMIRSSSRKLQKSYWTLYQSRNTSEQASNKLRTSPNDSNKLVEASNILDIPRSYHVITSTHHPSLCERYTSHTNIYSTSEIVSNNSDQVRTLFDLYSHASAAVSSSSDTRTVPWNVPATCDKLILSRTMTYIGHEK